MASAKGKVAIIGRYMKFLNSSTASFVIYLTLDCTKFGIYQTKNYFVIILVV